jgi:hypothetical protein
MKTHFISIASILLILISCSNPEAGSSINEKIETVKEELAKEPIFDSVKAYN